MSGQEPVTSAVLALGATDCEALHDAFLAQPVSAVSSLAFLAGAAVVWTVSHDQTGTGARWYASTLGLVGLGSAWYHGPQGTGAAVVHDVSLVLLLAQAVTVPVLRARRGDPVLAGRPSRTVAWSAAGVLAVAGAAYLLGRTGSPLCRPESVWQLHGLWHLLAAGAFTLWGVALWPRTPTR